MAARLQPLQGLSAFFRGRFEARWDGHTWTVDADFLDFGQRLRLYRDGEAAGSQKSPASFELGPETTIEAEMGMLGMRRIDLVADGATAVMAPADGTPEAWRLRLERERPGLSRAIGAASWVVLVAALVLGIGELIALVDVGIDSPPRLPGPLGIVFGLATLLAAFERALRFKSSRWLD